MLDKIKVQRANVVLEIPADRKQEYMSKGFSVINPETGLVTEEAIPTDVPSLQKKVTELKAELEKAKAEIAELKTVKRKSKASE